MKAITLEDEKCHPKNEDKSFWDAYNYIVQHQINATRSNSEEAYLNSVQNADVKEKAFVRDHLNRTLLHIAVEQSNKVLATYLVDVGLNVNDPEGCGLTALSLAVLQKNKDLVKLLVKYGPNHGGPLFTSHFATCYGQNNEVKGNSVYSRGRWQYIRRGGFFNKAG